MQGIFLNGTRPRSKKAIKDEINHPGLDYGPRNVHLEATSLFGNEYDGPLSDAPDGNYTFVGPDPYTSRKFYGTITKRDGKVTVK